MQTVTSIGLGPRAQKRAQHRSELLESARHLFEKRGFHGTKMRDVAGDAALSTGAMFNNWPTKEALYAEVFGHAPLTPEQGRALWSFLGGLGYDPKHILNPTAPDLTSQEAA